MLRSGKHLTNTVKNDEGKIEERNPTPHANEVVEKEEKI